MIPYYVDCLTPVYRRLLLSLHDIAKPNKKHIKCAKITGYATGTYHPHGSEAAYGALITLYKQGFVDVQGNFGTPGLSDASASAARYTEAKIKKWVDEFCFKYIDLVPWEEYEYEKEPLFLPSPIPIGLIGDGDIYSGLAFHRTVIPRYKLSDLAKRLKYLITEDVKDKIIIYPNLTRDGCSIKKEDKEAENILKNGYGSLTIIPNCVAKNNELRVQGRVPQHSFNSLKDDPYISCKCYSGSTIDVSVKPSKRIDDIQKFYQYVLKKHLIKNNNFIIYVCDDDGKVILKGVDNLLLTCYEYYVEISKVSLINDCIEQINKQYENEVILIIRKILQENPTVKTIDEIIKIFALKNYKIKTENYNEVKDCFLSIEKTVSDEDIKNVCNNKNIRALIEHKINIQENEKNIKDLKVKIVNNVDDCYQLICNYCNSKI
jgi:hypothetical protein